MEKIYIGFSRPKKWKAGAALIMWGEDTPYSHVYVRRESARVGNYVYQATMAGGVNFMGMQIFSNSNEIIKEYEVELTPEQVLDLVRFFVRNAGREYGFKQVLVLGALILADKLGVDCKNCSNWVINGEEEYICSELGAKILVDFKGENINGLDMVTPRRLDRHMETYYELSVKGEA